MHQYKKLKVWQKAVKLSLEIYETTKGFSDIEKFGLCSQIRRAAVSIPSNIAEGAGRNSMKEYGHFLNIAYGSSCELETQLIIAHRTGYLAEEKYNELVKGLNEIQKMIYAILKKLTSSYKE